MKAGEALSRLSRLQRTRRFKVIATVLVVVLGLGGYAGWALFMHAPAQGAQSQTERQLDEAGAPTDRSDGVIASSDERVIERVDFDVLRDMLGSRDATLGVGIGVLIAIGLMCLVIWLGAALTYLGIGLIVLLVATPLYLLDATRNLSRIVFGLGALSASFAVALEGLRLVLGARNPVAAVARNVLNEAVRMKISIVFIVMLLLLLSTLPGLLDESQPLRYRVQSFLQYGIAGAFWVLAILTLFFSVATVAFEQRDRVIWQTMSKPVAPWQYVFGKWVGVMAVNAALLSVSASGVFLFTEYLRSQPANGEIEAYVNASGLDAPTSDRLLLESQVLVARSARTPTLPEINEDAIDEIVAARVAEAERRGDLNEFTRIDFQNEVRTEVMREAQNAVRSVPPGAINTFVFENLQQAKRNGRPLTLRYKPQAGSNDPTQLYRLLLVISGQPIIREAPLNVTQTLALRPDAIDDEGRILVDIVNGDPSTGVLNPQTVTFPPDGLEVLYVAGGYELNFFRIMAALWVKLGFIAAVGIAGATFLSFPVACFLTFLVLFSAETSGYLRESLDVYFGMREDKSALVGLFVSAIARPISWMFSTYGDLNPTQSLVEGRLLSWASAFMKIGILTIWSGIALVAGWAIFRKRELATYSGS